MIIERPGGDRLCKALIFGPSGQGKTHFLGTAQEDERTAPMLLLDFEGGSSTLSGLEIDVAPIRSWDDYNEVYSVLSTGKHWKLKGSSLGEGEQYRSVGIDSVSETHTFALLDILEANANNPRRADPDALEIQDYGKASVQLRRLLRHFRDLPVHVFYTALAKEVDERGVGKVKVPQMSGQMAEELPGLMDVVAYLAQSEDEEGDVTRMLLLQNYPKFRTKARTPWGAECPDELEDATVTTLLDALEINSSPVGYEEEVEEEAENDSEEEIPGEDGDVDDDPYDEWKVSELRQECSNRGLPKAGKKDDLILRLEKDDEEEA